PEMGQQLAPERVQQLTPERVQQLVPQRVLQLLPEQVPQRLLERVHRPVAVQEHQHPATSSPRRGLSCCRTSNSSRKVSFPSETRSATTAPRTIYSSRIQPLRMIPPLSQIYG